MKTSSSNGFIEIDPRTGRHIYQTQKQADAATAMQANMQARLLPNTSSRDNSDDDDD